MKIRTLVSLGTSCQTTHQLTRFTNENPDRVKFQKGPFDWLICPPESAANWLDTGLEDFQPEEIVCEREHAYWPKFNFWFWHGFYTKSDTQRTLNIPANAQRELTKLNYQRQQFSKIDPSNTLFFVSNVQNNLATDVFTKCEAHLFTYSEPVCSRLHNSLSAFFKAPTSLKFITRNDRAQVGFTTLPSSHTLRPESSEWKGNDQDWDLLINQLIL